LVVVIYAHFGAKKGPAAKAFLQCTKSPGGGAFILCHAIQKADENLIFQS
jgi:hypothetical protein